jgi:hypothetical protein
MTTFYRDSMTTLRIGEISLTFNKQDDSVI